MLLVSKKKYFFWNTQSKSFFNVALFEGGSHCHPKKGLPPHMPIPKGVAHQLSSPPSLPSFTLLFLSQPSIFHQCVLCVMGKYPPPHHTTTTIHHRPAASDTSSTLRPSSSSSPSRHWVHVDVRREHAKLLLLHWDPLRGIFPHTTNINMHQTPLPVTTTNHPLTTNTTKLPPLSQHLQLPTSSNRNFL